MVVSHEQTNLLDRLLRAYREMAAIEIGDTYSLYEILHHASCQIVTTDAFYVCLYSERDGALTYTYLFDGNCHRPVCLPLGGGPSSWVVRNKAPFMLTRANRAVQQGGNRFGRLERMSSAALHVPMCPLGWTPSQPILGVMSTQSYIAQEYDEPTVTAFQWLANEAATILQRENDLAERAAEQEAAARQAAESERQIAGLAGEMVRMTTELSVQAEALRDRAMDADPEILTLADGLCRLCYRNQIKASHLSGRIPSYPHASPDPDNSQAHPFSLLTEREHEVLERLRRGESNAVIARQLFISVDTVKFHCNNLYRKLQVSNRVQAAQLTMPTPDRHAPPTRTGR